MNIRPAQPADAPIITDFNLRLAKETENLTLEPARVAAGVAAVLKDPAKGRYYLAEEQGTIVGQLMVTYEWSDWRNGNLWWIQSVFVQEQSRGRGIFRQLFQHLRELAQRQGDVPALRLYVHDENARARRSYEQLGMKRAHYEVFELELGSGK